MPKRMMSAVTLLTSTVLSVAAPALAAEVSSDRLINADKEPQNWLMNHRTYDAQRALIEKVCFRNWLRVLGQTLRETGQTRQEIFRGLYDAAS